jgi:RNA recognition motif-containing protein
LIFPQQQHNHLQQHQQHAHLLQQQALLQQQQLLELQPASGRRRGNAGRRNEEKVRRTVYISDISDAVTEAQLAAFFQDCGQLVDCRVCGDPNSSMRFAFIEFITEEAAKQV